jgi:hypothetical protein
LVGKIAANEQGFVPAAKRRRCEVGQLAQNQCCMQPILVSKLNCQIMETILKIYFSINFFIAGYNYAENVNWATKKSEKIKAYFLVIASVFFGIAIIVFAVFIGLLKNIWNYFNGYFQIAFWIDFYLLKKYNNCKKDILDRLNLIATTKKTSNSLRDRLYRKGVRLINKRNNFTYVYEEADF